MSALSLTLVGAYDPRYTRVDVIARGCAANGVRVEHRRVETSSPFKRTWRLRRLLAREPIVTDVVLVPAFGHHEVAVARASFRGPLVFDPLVSRYLTKIHDYRRAGRWSIHALVNHRVDRRSMEIADLVLSDTLAHRAYFVEEFGIPAAKIHPVYVGYNADDFRPAEAPPRDPVIVGFYGSFIPLHGIETILHAADLLRDRRDIRFEILGGGHTRREMEALAARLGTPNVTFRDAVPYGDLAGCIARWHLCLGIFGATRKADLVVPNKVFHYAACRRPMITKDTPAIREVFTDGRDVVLCAADPDALAARILDLAGSPAKAHALADAACRLVQDGYTHVHIGARVRALLETLAPARPL